MKFVKVELLSQLRLAAQGQPTTQDDQIAIAQSAPARKAISEAEMNYPFDGVVWTDEFFKLRSIVQAKCLGSH